MSLIIILFIVMLVIFSILWGNRTFSVKTLNQMIYHMVVPCDGTDEGCLCYKCPRHLGQCKCVKYCRETESILIFDDENGSY